MSNKPTEYPTTSDDRTMGDLNEAAIEAMVEHLRGLDAPIFLRPNYWYLCSHDGQKFEWSEIDAQDVWL